MALEQIRLIRDCERECAEKKKAAISNARHIIASANKEASQIITEAQKKAVKSGEKLLADARSTGEKEYSVLIDQAKNESQNMISSAQKNIDTAIDIILKRIVSSYGNS